MSQVDLDGLRPTLLALASTEVDAPDVPPAVVVQEAFNLVALLADPSVRTRLLSKGLPAAVIDGLGPAAGALSTAQAQWMAARDPHKSEAQAALELRAYELRTRLSSACRFHLRNQRKALSTLDVIAEGEGTADLIQDLHDLAELITQNVTHFAADTTFDAAERAATASSLASELRLAVSAATVTSDQAAAKDLRDRAYSHLDDVLANLRAAGRYAYEDDPATQTKFSSAYLRRRRQRNKKVTPPPTPTPV
jgi:hypothetical protein